jgi:hypothetical protein
LLDATTRSDKSEWHIGVLPYRDVVKSLIQPTVT